MVIIDWFGPKGIQSISYVANLRVRQQAISLQKFIKKPCCFKEVVSVKKTFINLPSIILVLIVLFPIYLCAKPQSEKDLLGKAEELTYEGQIKHAQGLLTDEKDKAPVKAAETADGGWDSTSLMLGMVWGAIGAGFFLYGKKQPNAVFLLCGIGLMVFPMFVTDNIANLVIGTILTILPFKVTI